MPCDQVRTSIVDLDKMDIPLLIEALRLLGYTTTKSGTGLLFSKADSRYTHRYEAGKIAFSNVSEREQGDLVNSIKQAYAGEVVKATAARFGWTLKQSATNKFAYTATRRG